MVLGKSDEKWSRLRKLPDFVAICPKNGGARGTGRMFTRLKKGLERVTGQQYTTIVIVCHLARLERTADSNMCEDENEVQRSTYG